MNNTLYVGGVSYNSEENDLVEAFSAFGEVKSVRIKEKRGDDDILRRFAFVDMADENAAQAALAGMDGQSLGGRTIHVKIAEPRPQGNFGGRNNQPRRPSHNDGGNDKWGNNVYDGRY